MINTRSATIDPLIRTCDVCKFRHQKCDTTKPTCGSCKIRNLTCIYSNTSARAVLGPSTTHDPDTNARSADCWKGRSSSLVDSHSKDKVADLINEVVQHDYISPSNQQQIGQLIDNTLHQVSEILRQSKTRIERPDLQKSRLVEVYTLLVKEFQDTVPTTIDKSNLQTQDEDKNTTLGTENNSHIRVINPFKHQTEVSIWLSINCFLQSVNVVFGFFERKELYRHVEMVYSQKAHVPNQVMSELCFALAIGAQIQGAGNDDMTIMWYENGRRYLDDDDWGNQLWVMRVTALICFYHIGDRRNTAHHYLEIAIKIGQANDLTTDVVHGQNQDSGHQDWPRVWNTIGFLQRWLTMGHNDLFERKIDSKIYSKRTLEDVIGIPETYQYMIDVSFILQDILQSFDANADLSVEDYDMYMKSLHTWAASLPESLQWSGFLGGPRDPRQLSYSIASEEWKAAMLHLHTMYLGALILLTRPVLIHVAAIQRLSHDVRVEPRAVELAYICIDSASDMAEFCTVMSQAQSFPPRAWLPAYFLFDALLVSIIGVIWQREAGEGPGKATQDIRGATAISQSSIILSHCAPHSKMALRYSAEIQKLKESITKYDVE